MDKLHEMFERHGDEYLEFGRIVDKRHPMRDVCAFVYLHERFGGSGDAITGAGHDEIYLWLDLGGVEMTEEDVIYVLRCGVRYDSKYGCLAMFV